MRILISPGRPLATVFRSLCAIALLFGAMAGTCQEPADDGVTPPPGQSEPGAPVVTIIAPLFDRNIAAGAIITITYSVANSPDNVIAFIDPDSDPENGNEVIFAEQLFGGENRTANFATEGIVSGVYNFGIQASNSAGTDTEYARNSSGQLVKITVNGFPQPALNAPSSDVEILFNTTTSVPLAFSCNDFENDVSWEVFYDTNQIIDGTEVTIASGTGNTDPGSTNVTVDWLTLSVPEGVYSIGLRCTDSANSVAFAYAEGQVTITSELSVPTVTLTQPEEDLTVFTDTDISIAFAASNTSVQGATITLFLDMDDNGFDGSEPRIATELPLTATSVTVNSNIIPEGVYFIGGIVELDGRRSDARYAPGQLTVIGTGDITVVQPADPLTVTPGTDVVIRWDTNLPQGEGLIDLALFQSDIFGNPGAPVSPDPLADAKDLEITPSTVVLDTITLTTGFYVVEVTLTPVDANDVPTGDPSASALSVPIRLTTQPTVLWTGRIDKPDLPGHFDGVIFEGLQFEDNAGTDFLAVGNIDGQAGDDFIIGARFAKPLFTNAAGVGSGEAYLLYSDGRVNRSNRRWSLNATGADMGGSNDPNALPGLLFFGIRFDPRSEDIDGSGTLTLGCFTENRQFDGGKLDQWDEDINGNGVLDEYEDIDLDGFLDINEDGTLWPDFNCDGLADNPALSAPHFFDAQYINGFLDTGIVEDRDGDGLLDLEGDDTAGLTSLGLVPDADGDGRPEIVFGFHDTDSVKPGRPTDRVEPAGFGTLVQPNQFERGGIVIVSSSHESMITDPSFPGRFNDDRILELDRVGQEFFDVFHGNPDVGNCCGTNQDGGCSNLTISACVCAVSPICCVPDDPDNPNQNGWDEDCVPLVDSLECSTCIPPSPVVNQGPGIVGDVIPGRPIHGMDAYPLMFDTVSAQAPDLCAGDQFGLYVINNTQPQESLVAVPNLFVNGELNQPAPMAGTIKTLCFPCDVPTFNVQLGSVVLDVLETGEIVYIIPEPDSNTNSNAACGESIIVGINGPDQNGDYDSLFVCEGNVEDDECDPLALGLPFGCETSGGSDGCFENLAGPLFGFSYAGLTGGNSSFEDPSHPLAYDQTLSNPHVRADLFADLAGPCSGGGSQNICGHVHGAPDLFRNPNGAPPFDRAASGFYPGATEEDGPVGARILGQGVGDQFGQAISMTPDPAEGIVFVSAPNRTIDGMPGTGAVYQWRMHRYWHSPFPNSGFSNGLSRIDAHGGTPKPHQYIIKDLGFDTPDNLIGDVEGSLMFAITYTGADAGDELGATMIGITDFNGDALDDLLIGAPGADGANNAFPNSGAVYVVYRRPPTIEGEAIDLGDIARGRNDPNRLNGMLINGESGSRMGEALAGNCDLNGDGTNDIVIGSPDALSGRGEVIIVFGSPDPDSDYLPSPAEGYSVQELVDAGHAVRIRGAFDDDHAGFNVICNGDFDGDGQNDLVISAPFAEPMFDSDGDDVLDTPGLDLDRDGQLDLDENGLPLLADPTNAGVVYVITNMDQLSGVHDFSEIGAALQGFMFAGLNGGDQLGGGRETKRNTRSQGLAYAGDVDGDGKDDLLIGAIFADPNNKTNAGEVYLIYGFTASQAADF
ncbi:MAG: FG-GAP repeat protein [Planctomycetes bacterium]|nr:FG-GAP repeat protein [Planctomycetota bacterium]